MSELRWIILGIGLVVIAAVYFFSRDKKSHPEASIEPASQPAGSEPYVGGFESEPVIEDVAIEPQKPAADEQLILTLHVTARVDEGFGADELATALTAAGLKLGLYDIYHYSGDDADTWFSAANRVEPGRFPEPGSDGHAPGVTLFMTLPGSARPQDALDAMLLASRRLAQDLDGELIDSRRKPLTAQAAQRMRERLAEYRAGGDA